MMNSQSSCIYIYIYLVDRNFDTLDLHTMFVLLHNIPAYYKKSNLDLAAHLVYFCYDKIIKNTQHNSMEHVKN